MEITMFTRPSIEGYLIPLWQYAVLGLGLIFAILFLLIAKRFGFGEWWLKYGMWIGVILITLIMIMGEM